MINIDSTDPDFDFERIPSRPDGKLLFFFTHDTLDILVFLRLFVLIGERLEFNLPNLGIFYKEKLYNTGCPGKCVFKFLK